MEALTDYANLIRGDCGGNGFMGRVFEYRESTIKRRSAQSTRPLKSTIDYCDFVVSMFIDEIAMNAQSFIGQALHHEVKNRHAKKG